MYYHYMYLHSLAIPYNSNIFVIVHELFFVAYQSKQDRSVLLALLTWYKVVTPSISNSIHFITRNSSFSRNCLCFYDAVSNSFIFI